MERYTPLLEPISLDEAYLDVTGSQRLFGPAPQIGRRIKEEIRESTRLTASIGVASNKFLAKLASDLEKPDGFVVIRDEEKVALLRPLPVSCLWGVGKMTAPRLEKLGLRTIGDVQDASPSLLRAAFGREAAHFRELAFGVDESPVVSEREAKSLGSERTFPHDLEEQDEMLAALLEQTEEVSWRLRGEGLLARTVTLKVRYANFRTITRQITLPASTDLTASLWEGVEALFRRWWRKERGAVRLLGITASGLSDASCKQKSLFPDEREIKHRRLAEAADRLRDKFGPDVLQRGLMLKRGRERPESE